MSSKRRHVADRSGRSNTPSYFEEELEDIELGHDPRTKLAEPDLSPITEESRPGSSSTSAMLNQPWSPIMNDEQVASDSESYPDVQTPGAWKKTLPDTEYPALPPNHWVSETPLLVRDRDLGRGTSPETFAETFRLDQKGDSQAQAVEDQVHEEYNRYLMSANIFAKRWEDSPQPPRWLATVEEDLALQLAGRARPLSPRDYWEDEGPVRREHFDEYKELKEQNERNLAKLFFRAGRKMQDLQKEVRLKQEEIEELEKVIVVLQARAVNLEYLGIRAQKLPEHPDSRTPRKPREKVYKNDYSSRHFRPPLTELPGTREFLFDDSHSRTVELMVETLLQRAYVSIELADWDLMWAIASKAHQSARELQYQPLLQRCHFYLGVAAFGRADYAQAAESLEWAAKCRNYYYEGELVAEWHIRAKKKDRERKAAVEAEAEGLKSGDSSRTFDTVSSVIAEAGLEDVGEEGLR
ncbi:hypothetical protein MMC27_006498 [Xylographa pallens]|nr:hypothetical protein [Xylographa pallens]